MDGVVSFIAFVLSLSEITRPTYFYLQFFGNLIWDDAPRFQWGVTMYTPQLNNFPQSAEF